MANPAEHPPTPEPAAGNALLDQMAQQHLAAAPPAAPSAAPEDSLNQDLESQLAALLSQAVSMAPSAAPAADPAGIDAMLSSDAQKLVEDATTHTSMPIDPAPQTADAMNAADVDALLNAEAKKTASQPPVMDAAPAATPTSQAPGGPEVQHKIDEAESVLEAELQKLMSQSMAAPEAAAPEAKPAAPAVAETVAAPEVASLEVPALDQIAPPEMMEGEMEAVAPASRRLLKRTGPSLFTRLGKLLGDVLLMLLQLVDMPFAEVPAEVKGMLGVAGLTLATTGVAVLGYVMFNR